jgi:hypothetical protein
VIFPPEILRFSSVDFELDFPDNCDDVERYPVPIPDPCAAAPIPLHSAVIFPPEIVRLFSVDVDVAVPENVEFA